MAATIQGLVARIDELEATVAAKDEQIAELEEELDRLRSQFKDIVAQFNSLQRQIEGGDYGTGATTELQKYTRIVEDGLDESVEASRRRAVAIHRHWDDWKQRLGEGTNARYGISTNITSSRKYAPAQIRVDLEEALDEDLRMTQVKRAMKQLAKLSGGESERDASGRLHIRGGTYECHERTPPDNRRDNTYWVVVKP